MQTLLSSRRAFLSRRGWVGLLVSGCWLGMMFLIWRREGGGGAALNRMGLSPEVLLVNWNDFDQWMWIEQQGKRLGAARTTIRVDTAEVNTSRSSLPDYTMDNRWRLSFRMMGFAIPIDAALHVRMDGNFEMRTLQCRAQLAGRLFTLQSFVEDRNLFYEARIQADTANSSDSASSLPSFPALGDAAALPMLQDREVRGRAPLQGPMLLDDVVAPILVRRGNLQKGQTWQTRVSDPIGGLVDQTVRVRVEELESLRIGDRVFEAWRLSENTDTLETSAWYDSTGNLLRREAYGGLVWLRAETAEVLKDDPAFRQEPAFDPIDRERIKNNLDPELDGKPIKSLLPELPGL